MTPIVWETNRR